MNVPTSTTARPSDAGGWDISYYMVLPAGKVKVFENNLQQAVFEEPEDFADWCQFGIDALADAKVIWGLS